MNAERKIPFARPWITDEDRKAVAEVLNGHILTHGPQCKSFEKEFGEFLGPEAHCVSVSSCMAALHLAYLHFGIGPGDEVIVPAQTHTATAHAVECVGAIPVFVDCDPNTGNVTAEAVSLAITSRTKGLSVVHFVGIPCEMPAIMEIARAYNLKVIEDCALAVGARYQGRHVGLFGDAGCFSFYPVKHMTTGEGGMFVSRHKAVADAVATLRAFGVDRTHSEQTVLGMYDVPTLGLNYRMSEVQAALGRTQLGRIKEALDRRSLQFSSYKKSIQRLSRVRILNRTNEDAISSHYCADLVFEGPLAKKRGQIVEGFNAAGIGTSIYYPQPVPRMTYYKKKYGYNPGQFPGAEALSDYSVALPLGMHVDDNDIDYVTSTVEGILKSL